MAEVVVRPMTAAEFGAWSEALAQEYAEEQVATGNWPREEALDLARRGNADALPDGPATARMLLLRALRPDGVPVGVLWIGLTHPRGAPDCAFLHDLAVDEEHRGAGYGRALLAAAEDAVRSVGVGALMLNVFGGNTRARRLYEAAGYETVTLQLRKELR